MSPEAALTAARLAADLLLELAPLTARMLLDEAAVRRANAMADYAEVVKFGEPRDR